MADKGIKSPDDGTQNSFGRTSGSQNEPTRGVRKSVSLRRGAAGYNQLLQAAVMASIETRNGNDNLNGDDDDGDAPVGFPAPPPPSPDSIMFTKAQISTGTSAPIEGCDMGISPFGDSSPNRNNKRTRSHERQDDDGDERMPTLARTDPSTVRSLEDDSGDFDGYDDTSMDQDMTTT